MDPAFQWVPFYEALADKLFTYNDKRSDLFQLMKRVASEQPLMKYLNFQREDWWGPRKHQIDPFSVLAVFNRGVSDKNRTMLAEVLAETFGITLPVPTQFAGIPVLDNRKSFFSGVGAIWNLFIASIKAAEANTFNDEFKSAFEEAIRIKDNGLASITMGLYWIRPNTFMPLDGNSRAFLSDRYGVDAPSLPCSGNDYVKFLTELKAKISQQSPNTTLPEVSYTAWMRKSGAASPGAIDEQQRREAFKRWYANKFGTDAANTASSAIGKARLKIGRSLFAIALFEELDAVIRNGGLADYFQSGDGDYSKMDAIFDIDKTAQRDELKSGVKHYLSFLKSLEERQDYTPVTVGESKIIDVDLSDRSLLDKLHQMLKDWRYDSDIEFGRVYNVYANGQPNFTSNEQRIEYPPPDEVPVWRKSANTTNAHL